MTKVLSECYFLQHPQHSKGSLSIGQKQIHGNKNKPIKSDQIPQYL